MSELTEAFGQRLVVARFNFGRASQETVADRAGIHRTQMSLLESGARLPNLETVVRVAGGVGLSAGELLGPIRWEPGMPGRFILTDEEPA
jgi:transcriptional regulator with XRE-family HTH domain